MDINLRINQEFNLTMEHTNNIINLLDEGNTIPFIARYRKELTGHIDDQVLRQLNDRLLYLRNLEKRKEEVKKSIDEQGKLTEEIINSLTSCETLTEVEDVYRPFKQKKKTRATVAISKGLLPLADIIFEQESKEDLNSLAKNYINEELDVKNETDALNGAKDIIAEKISDNAELRKKLRSLFLKLGVVYSSFTKDAESNEKSLVYEMYKDFSEAITELKSHRILALNRGESEKFLKVKVKIDETFAEKICESFVIKKDSNYKEFLASACSDAYGRLIEPSIEREVRNLLTDNAQEKAIKMFEVNLKPLLMQAPLKNKIVMGYDPGYRTGCKIAVVDETGKVLDKTVIYATINKDTTKDKLQLKSLIDKYNVDVISIGNGTASKESEMFVNELIKDYNGKVSYIVVSEAGASVYSASELGAKEFPDYDVAERSAVSIARRLQDPLAELIKIDPKSIGVGQYQHDMPEARLDEVLNGVLEDCVNTVGVDLNTASVQLLSHVAGLNSGIAKNIVEYRETNGKFSHKEQLLKVKKLGEKAYTQCAGFLRIPDSKNILETTGVHPESYSGAKKLFELFGLDEKTLKSEDLSQIREKASSYGFTKTATYCGLGIDTLMDVIYEIEKPGRDIRDTQNKPILRDDLLDISSLKEGMEIVGTVRNVTDFGAFVDIGVHQDGLVHVSQICSRYIKHPSEAVKVNDIVKVKVIGVDVKKKRISLTMKDA